MAAGATLARREFKKPREILSQDVGDAGQQKRTEAVSSVLPGLNLILLATEPRRQIGSAHPTQTASFAYAPADQGIGRPDRVPMAHQTARPEGTVDRLVKGCVDRLRSLFGPTGEPFMTGFRQAVI